MSCESPLLMKKICSFLPYPNDHVPENVLRKAEDELRETPEVQEVALKELKNMLQESPKTKKIQFEDDFLIHYLRASKYTTGKPFKQLQNYVDLRTKYNNIFHGIPDEYFSTKLSTQTINILPERCPDGCTVLYIQVGKWNTEELPLENMKSLLLFVYVQLLRDPMVQINGYKAIYDFKGSNIQHVRILTIPNAYLMYNVVFNCCPSRIKEVHFVNPNIVLNVGWKLMSPFLSKKLRSRCHFHSDDNKLLEFFPSSMLPAKYGGDLSDVVSTELHRRLNKEQQNRPIQGQPNFY